VRDVCFQYFCGGVFFEHEFPFNPSDFVHFRKRVGESGIKGVKIIIPSTPKKRDSQYQKQSKREKCRARVGIEPIIGHLKSDYRMQQNYLWGEEGI
jgi:IS5 family transposase